VNNEKEFCSEVRKKWLPPELYIGGAEHTYMHLLFARFFVKAMHKIGLLDFDEPFPKLRHQGMVLDKEGKKMSKSKGNVVNPDDMIEKFGADSVRAYMLFAAPLEDEVTWNENNIVGVYRFLEKVWSIKDELKESSSEKVARGLHKLIKKSTESIENLKYNTVISDMMKFVNLAKKSEIGKEEFKTFLKILSPFAPHITEELWFELGSDKSIHLSSWPQYDEDLIKDKKVMLIIQVDGKVRDKVEVDIDENEEGIKKIALDRDSIQKWINGKNVKKTVYIKHKIINFVISR
jgi:leucyl-tRNA synthetase